MALDYATFVVQFPEFKPADANQVLAHIAAAALEIDRSVWGPKADQGQAYLTAHKLALSPFGQGTRLVKSDGSTTYWVHYENLRYQVSSGFRVA